ncbi:MAG: peptidoglycan bridge formation glycyltransferase FemA/FemB family protein [Candidatus Andersenbacteria bacterium]
MQWRQAAERDADAWNECVFASPSSSFLQTWEWGEIQKKLGVNPQRFVVESDGVFQAVFLILARPLPLGRSWLYIPRGPIVRDDALSVWTQIEKGIEEIVKKERPLFVRLDPALTDIPDVFAAKRWRKAEREVQPRHTLLLDLTPGEDDLLAALASKTRYNVRLSQRKGVTIRFSSEVNDVDTFLQLAQDVHSRSGFSFHPDEYYRGIMEVLGPQGLAELAIAEYEGVAVAAHLMVYAGPVATYAHGASSSQHRNLMAPTRLYWETILRAKSRGCTTYDFFGVAPKDAASDHPWSGITRIKQGFSGTYTEYIGAYDFAPDTMIYNAFHIARRIARKMR